MGDHALLLSFTIISGVVAVLMLGILINWVNECRYARAQAAMLLASADRDSPDPRDDELTELRTEIELIKQAAARNHFELSNRIDTVLEQAVKTVQETMTDAVAMRMASLPTPPDGWESLSSAPNGRHHQGVLLPIDRTG